MKEEQDGQWLGSGEGVSKGFAYHEAVWGNQEQQDVEGYSVTPSIQVK